MTPFLVLTAVAVGVHLDIFGALPGSHVSDQPPRPQPMQAPSTPKPPPPPPDAGTPPPASGSVAPAQPAPSGQKPSPASISADVWILHGTNNNTGIAPNLSKMVPLLSKPPFSSYNSYSLIAQGKLSLQKGTAVAYTLPTGRDLRIVYKDVSPQPKPTDPLRYVIAASIQKPDGKTFLPLVEVSAQAGEMFFVGGQEYKGGSLFIGIKVAP